VHTVRRVRRQDAESLAERLDLELYRDGVCLPCLTLVAFPLADGDAREAARSAREVLPTLWIEGLDEVARRALGEARHAGDPRATEALDDLEQFGSDCAIARAIVMRLARAMVVGMRARRN
jgi:hypothetical protein